MYLKHWWQTYSVGRRHSSGYGDMYQQSISYLPKRTRSILSTASGSCGGRRNTPRLPVPSSTISVGA